MKISKRVWLRIDEKKPKIGSICWYWFEVFQKVYAGKYKKNKEKRIIDPYHYAC